MPKFEIIIDELVNHQHRVVVAAQNEYEVEEALDYADSCRDDFACDYVDRIGERLEILRYDDVYGEDVKGVDFNDFNELKEGEDD